MVITAYTAPGEILMINVAELEWDHSELTCDESVCVDLDAEGRVIGIEVVDRSKFDLAAVAAEFDIAELIPEIEAAIAVAKPGP